MSASWSLWGCTINSAGDKYISTSESTGGLVVDICTGDFQGALQDLSLAAAGLSSNFTLNRVPNSENNIEVSINGQSIPQDTQNGWTYDSVTNSIRFHGNFVPLEGDSIDVVYEVALECSN